MCSPVFWFSPRAVEDKVMKLAEKFDGVSTNKRKIVAESAVRSNDHKANNDTVGLEGERTLLKCSWFT